MKRLTASCGLALALSMPAAQAVNQEIRALFRPDSSQPNKNVFINQTPNSGYCAEYPGECAENSMFSIQLPFRFTASRFLGAGEGIPLKVPANWRRLTVTNVDTQETEVVEVRISGIGSKFYLSESAAKLVGVSDILEGHQKLWTNKSWVYASAPCQYSGVGFYSPETYRFFWKTPVEAACVKVAAYFIPDIYFDTLDVAYELRTPNPLGMSSGLYTGSMAYRVGPSGDFDFGQTLLPNDGNLTLDFVLDVQHTLKVDIPPGGNNVTLEPVGGWAPWLDSGRKPTRIFRDQLFYISASSRFKVLMLCNSTGGTSCKMGSQEGNSSDFEVFMSLPAGISGPGGPGANVTRHPLRFNVWAGPFQPGLYVDRKPGTLHFEMTPFAIDFLLRPGVTDRLRGNVTVIWDSDV